MWRAVTEGRQQCAIFTEFTAALEDEDAPRVAKTRKNVELWESDPKKHKNPYNLPKKSTYPVADSFYHAADCAVAATIKQIRHETEPAKGNATSKVANQASSVSSPVTAPPPGSSARGAARAPSFPTIN